MIEGGIGSAAEPIDDDDVVVAKNNNEDRE